MQVSIDRRGRDRDHGAIMLVALVFVVVLGGVGAALASYAQTSLFAERSSLDRVVRRAAVEGGTRIALESVRLGTSTCGTASSVVLTTTISSAPVSVACQRQSLTIGETGQIALALTSEGLGSSTTPLVVGENNSRVAGNLYFANAPTSLAHTLSLENGDVWFGSNNCANAATPSITNLLIATAERTYLCTDSKWATVFPPPSVGAVPTTTNPAKNTTAVPGCTVYFPGRYTTAPDLDNEGDVYFASGLYWFDSVGSIQIKQSTVIGGTPGASSVSEADEVLPWGACSSAPTNATVLARSSGTGVTWVFGGSSRITMDNKSYLELFAPSGGDSIVAYDKNTNGFSRTTVGVSTPLIEQIHQSSEFSVHGRVYAPASYLRIGNYTKVVDPEGALVLGGAVLARLELKEAPPSTGYNLQVPTVAVKYRILVTATSGPTSLRVAAELRPSGDQLAVSSWRVVW